MKIRSKLTLVCCLILLLSIYSLAVATHKMSSYFVANTSMKYSSQIIDQLNSNIESRFELMDAVASQVLLNSDIFNHLCKAKDIVYNNRASLDRYYAIQGTLTSLCTQNELLSAITLYCLGSSEVIATDKQTNWPSSIIPENAPWFRLLLETDTYFTSFIKYDDSSDAMPVRYSIARKVIDRTTKSVIGIVVVDSSIKEIENMLSSYDFGPDSAVIIRDQTGREVFSSNPESELSRLEIPEEDELISLHGQEVLVSTNVSGMTGWTVSCMIPLRYITKDIQVIYPAFFLIALLNFCIAIVAVYFVAKSITRPLEELGANMNEIAKGNWNIEKPSARQDEIGILRGTFYDMAFKIQELIQSTYVMQLAKKEAELKMFQLQTEPHFIYNAMEAIRIKAAFNEDYEVSSAITALGKFLRLKLNTATQDILVSEEMEHVIGYYRLVTMCQQTTVKLNIRIDESLYQERIVKLSIQPLVENTMKYAFNQQISEPTVWVEGKRTADGIQFCVRDNGVGVSEEKLHQIRTHLLQTDDENHIGLQNVDHRLKLTYGSQYGLVIESVCGRGMSVRFRIPEEKSAEAGER